MDTTRLKYLLKRHITDVISASEAEELAILLQKTDPELQEELLAEVLEETEYGKDLKENRKQIIYSKIITQIAENPSEDGVNQVPVRGFHFLKKYMSIAAILLVGLAIGMWLWTADINHRLDEINMAATDTDDIYLHADSLPFVSLPGGGTQLLIEDQGQALMDLGIRLLKEEDGETVYAIQNQVAEGALPEKSIVFSTPKGHTNKILLADGTQIWLNSGSSLEYPAAFSATERRVKLIGEGYFDIAHDSRKPFFVETDKGPVIEVLGTSFNLSAYQEESTSVTTLVKGKVRLVGNNYETILKPNQQVVGHAENGMWKKSTVNVEDFISWKDGYFTFNTQSVEEILTTVQRWYNLEDVAYRHRSTEKFSGTFKRTKSLKSLLVKLEKISNVKFEIKERRIVVSDKN